jgi:hypothetical protein
LLPVGPQDGKHHVVQIYPANKNKTPHNPLADEATFFCQADGGVILSGGAALDAVDGETFEQVFMDCGFEIREVLNSPRATGSPDTLVKIGKSGSVTCLRVMSFTVSDLALGGTIAVLCQAASIQFMNVYGFLACSPRECFLDRY